MTGICGWIDSGGPLQPDGAGGALTAMAARLGAADMASSGQADQATAVAFRSRRAGAGAARFGDLLVVIDGRPRWRDAALAALAAAKGHPAALAEAYRRDGDGLLDGLLGDFSLAVLDTRRNRALLAIDRMGIGRLYHARPRGGGLVFGSTADAVAAHPGVTSTLSEQGIYEFLFFYFSPAPRTIYLEQTKLQAGERLVYEAGAARTEPYWRMPYSDTSDATAEALAETLRRNMKIAVERTVGDGEQDRIGAFLSGGLDSSTVSGLLSEAVPDPVKCFTIGFDQPGYDEMEYAALTARRFGAAHHPYYLTIDDLLEAIPKIAAAYDEPFGNSSAVPTYICARQARANGVDIMIAGDGGDELFAGNERYVSYDIYERYNRLPGALRKGLVEPAVRVLSNIADNAVLRKGRNFLRTANTPMPDRVVAFVPFLTTPLETMFEADFVGAINPRGPLDGLREIFERTPSSSLAQRMMHIDLQRTLADNDLLKVGRMCEIAGVEVRYPFLDDDLVNFSAGVPARVLLAGGELRRFYKNAFSGFLAPETITKSKQGFGLPTVEWMRGSPDMLEMVRDGIESFAARGYMRAAFCQHMIQNLIDGGSPYLSSSAWDVLMLELWLRERGFSA